MNPEQSRTNLKNDWLRLIAAVLAMTGLGSLAVFPSLADLGISFRTGIVICVVAAAAGFISASVDYALGLAAVLAGLGLAGAAGGSYAHYVYRATGDPRIPAAFVALGVGAIAWAWASLGWRVFRRDALFVKLLSLLGLRDD